MLVDKIGKVVKSTPILRNLLFPVVTHLWKEREERFRRYCRELPKLVLEPFFVKIGANDGITGDPCTDILLGNANWRGLLVEPVPYCFARLRASFPDSQRFRLEQVAIGFCVWLIQTDGEIVGMGLFGGFFPAAGPLAEGFGIFLGPFGTDDDKDGGTIGGEDWKSTLGRNRN